MVNAVKVYQKHSHNYDDCYYEWFECPRCHQYQLIRTFRYCPDCGVKLIWMVKSF